jgi:NosR/NirI family nitrous oxide reductase transcriptional regulator
MLAAQMTRRYCRLAVLSMVIALGCLLVARSAWALGDEPRAGETVTQYLTPDILQALFPAADKIGEVSDNPPSAPVYKAGRPAGYIFSTWDVTQSRGFSNRPIVLLVGLNLAGRITGAKLVHHTEPIAILGVPDEAFFHFTEQFAGYDIKNGVDVVKELSASPLGRGRFSQRTMPGEASSVRVDAVGRATNTSVLISDAVVRGARIVARDRAILPPGRRRRIDLDRFAAADWHALETGGAIAHLHLTYRDVRAGLRQHGAIQIEGDDGIALPDSPFLDLYVALLTPAGIGINLLGKTWYDQYSAGRRADDQMLLVAVVSSNSLFSADSEHADAMLPLELVQHDKTIRLSVKQTKTLPFLHAKGNPGLTEQALVFLQGERDLDPGLPWQMRLLVSGKTRDGKPAFADFSLTYKLPEAYLLPAATESSLPWRAIWWNRKIQIAILSAALVALTAILLLQDQVSRRPRLHRWLRIGFLSWTLIWLGWYAGAQLTVVQVITWIHTLVTGFRWDYLLADPLITILLGFTVVGLFLWGRAAFCGWLCPFGALQELANEVARGLRIPQIRIPTVLHARLVTGKYVLFVALVAVSFYSWDLAMAGTEIEPFKAAIILRFMTEWPMVLYAAALLAASLFIERFYCRFACPLGGGLALFGKVRLFDWLKRHPECGSPCRFCESVCPVGAIQRSGKINMNECFFCLDCQVTYYDDHTCPPMVWRRKQLERAQ